MNIDPKKVIEILDFEEGILAEIEESPTPFTSWTEYLVLSEQENKMLLSVMRRRVLGEVQFDEDGESLDLDEIGGESIFREEDGYYLGYDLEVDEEYGQVMFTKIDENVLSWLSSTNFDKDDLEKIINYE